MSFHCKQSKSGVYIVLVYYLSLILLYLFTLFNIGILGNQNSRACVSNITVRESIIKMSEDRVGIKIWKGGPGSGSGVTFKNIHIDTIKNPIIID